MGRAGPPPKPTPLRILEGNPGKLRVPPEVPPAPGPCDAPAHISADARAIWEAFAPELEAKGLLAPRYLIAFEVLCDAVVQYRRAAAVLARTGPVIQGRGGEMVTNPAGREFARYGAVIRAYASDFGMSPAALTAIARGGIDAPVDRASPARLLG